MAKKQPKYDDSNIELLNGEDRVRKKPAVIFGSDGLDGCEQAFFEILSNSVDEAREGYGSEVLVTVYKDMTIQVEDSGRGVPLGFNEKEGRYNWDLVYCELYAGGKYDTNSDSSAYTYSIGTNGLGAASTQFASEFMHVTSYRNGEVSEISFKKGKVDSELQVRPAEKKDKKSGTVVRWRPDLEVFTDINIPEEFFSDTLKRQAASNKGIKFILNFESDTGFKKYEYVYENGIVDYLKEIVGDDFITTPEYLETESVGKEREDRDEYKFKVEMIFCASNKINLLEYYHNSSWLEDGGSPDKAVKAAFPFAIDKYLKSNGKYNKNESKVSFTDVQESLVFISNSFSTYTSYFNQTKKKITNTFITSYMTDYLKSALEVYFAENPKDAERICQQVLINKRSRESAENTRVTVKKKLVGTIDIANRIEKFVNCRSKDPEKREVYIVEGDSACTSCKLGRDADFQAIIPVRGKTLNCLKAGYDRIFKSEIITDLLRVVGCGVEISGKVTGNIPKFDPENLKWNKIIICTDADEDGFQIRTLLLTLFYRLIPTLISMGKIYIAESPLYEITCGDDIYFAYDEPEKEKITAGLEGKKYTLQRSKGLGENEPDMMWQTTMNPATRRLIRVTETDADKTAQIFETLLGNELEARKSFITEYGHLYSSEADV